MRPDLAVVSALNVVIFGALLFRQWRRDRTISDAALVYLVLLVLFAGLMVSDLLRAS